MDTPRPLLNWKLAWEIVGGLSTPSKMPCYGYSISAARCVTGSKLAKVPGTICNKCYAMRGNYRYPTIQSALERRYTAIMTHPLWVHAMISVITAKEHSGFFRWHDSGDVQSVEHLRKIVQVCEGTPHIKHWLPTREYSFVNDFLASGGKFPANLTVRLSALSFNSPLPLRAARRMGVQVSGASSDGNYNCPAPKQANECGQCRNCWDKQTEAIIYKRH